MSVPSKYAGGKVDLVSMVGCANLRPCPEEFYAWYYDGLSVDAAHHPGAGRKNLSARRNGFAKAGQVHHSHLLRRIPFPGPAACQFADETGDEAR